MFESPSGSFQARITGDLLQERVADYSLTYAEMDFTSPGWDATGLTAVWYCQSSHRLMQLVVIHKHPHREMERFMSSFSSA